MSGDRRARFSAQDGNTLVLFPAAMLILLALVALSLDAAVAHLAQRRLADLAASVANDATTAMDLDAYYGRGDLTLDASRAAARMHEQRVAIGRDRGLEDVSCSVTTNGPVVVATCDAVVRPVVAPVFTTLGDRMHLRAVEAARAAER